jgi:disulfide bond formation protein DsbB
MAHFRGFVVLLLCWLYRLARCVVAGLGLAALIGPIPAAVAVLLCAALRLQWGLRILAALALWHLWHWPLWVAVPAAAPRLVLMLPGLITIGLARLRHPRPRWPAPAAAAQLPVPRGP